ncbi:MAG: outer membrane beta-barrel protein [Puniceicoccales bacterium]|nr:outer membrane beta-barrel protein [Puniceicoccales bacterium]
MEEIIAQDATGATAAVTESNKKLQKSAADWLAQIARWEKARDEALLAKKIKKNDAGAVRSNSEKKVPVTVVRPNWFIGVGVGGELASWSGDAKGGFLPGAVFTGGAYLSSDKKSFWRNVSLYGDIGFFIGSWNDTVTYSESYGDALGLGAYNGWTERAWQSRKSEQLSIPVLATLAYNFSFGKSADGGERFNLRVGPSLGVIYVSMKSKFGDGTLLGIYDPDGNRRASITGVEPPQDTNQSGSKVLLTYGVSIGASWNLARRWTLDLAYRFHATTALDLGAGRNYGQSTNHQFTFGANWRF